MVKKVRQLTKIYLSSIVASLSFIPLSHAYTNYEFDQLQATLKSSIEASTQASTQASASIKTSIDNLIAGYGTTHQAEDSLFFLATPFNKEFKATGELFLSPAGLPFSQTILSANPAELAYPESPANIDTQSFFSLSPVQQQSIYSLNSDATSIDNLYKRIFNQECPQKTDTGCTFDNTNLTAGKSYDMNTFLGPVAYDGTDKVMASRYIQYAAMAINPFEVPATDKLIKAENTGKRYVLTLRSYVAAQAAGLSSLYEMYKARVPVTGLGTKAELKVVQPGTTNVVSKADASPLEIEAYAATRRLNPYIVTDFKLKNSSSAQMNWQTAMENASPITLQRETVYLLAEMRAEMFKARLEAERLRALLALLQLNQNQQAMAMQDINLKLMINNMPTPTPPTPSDSGK